MRSSKVLFLVALIALPGACDQLGSTEERTRVDAAKGRAVFQSQCAACHGPDATGGGVASLGLGVIPPDLTTIAKRNGGAFPQDEVMSTIDGFYRREHFNDPMPVFGEGDLGPLVQIERDGVSTPVPANLLALANYLESIQRP